MNCESGEHELLPPHDGTDVYKCKGCDVRISGSWLDGLYQKRDKPVYIQNRDLIFLVEKGTKVEGVPREQIVRYEGVQPTVVDFYRGKP
jgi:hypothetical protein